MELSLDQQAATEDFLNFLLDPEKKEIVLEGHSGTGKTFLTNHLVEVAVKNAKLLKIIGGNTNSDITVEFTASTNKAASVLQKRTGLPVSTIHSLLGLRVMNNFSSGTTSLKKSGKTAMISNTLLIIDEASMIDAELLTIIRELTYQCKVLYIGDPYQLAPVFETNCPVFEQIPDKMILNTIQRQVVGNPIIEMGENLRKAVINNTFPAMATMGDKISHVDGPTFQRLITEAFTSKHDKDDYKILAWTNAKVHAYNSFVRSLLTTEESFYPGEFIVTNKPIMSGKNTYAKTDEVVCVSRIRPAEEHGIEGWWVDLGFNEEVFLAKEQWRVKEHIKQLAKVAKTSGNWVAYFERQEFFSDLRPIYSSTVHKSQGSTHNTVFIDLTDIGSCKKWQEVARMLYVAITRASDKVVLYGELPKKYTPDGN